MQQAPIILETFLLFTAMIMVYIVAWTQLRSRINAAREFSWIMSAVVIYTVGYAIEITRNDLPGILAAIKLEYLGLALTPALMLIFALRFIGKKLSKIGVALVFIVPMITMALVFTIEYHEFYYIRPKVIQGILFPTLVFERGVWYYINLAYLQIVSALASVLLIVHLFRVGAKYRKQAVMIAVGSLIPLLANAVYQLGLTKNIDSAPFSFFLTGLIISIALFKFGLFELVPAARELAIDSIKDGFLVFDRQGRLQDLNSAAWLLPGARELKVGDRLPQANSLAKELHPLLTGQINWIDFSVNTEKNGSLYFHATSHPILTKTGAPGGTALLISDVTEAAELVKQLNQLASTDELTGALNRRSLIQLSENELTNASRQRDPVGIIMIDLDHFKNINDQFGHAAGDEVLKNIAQCFKKTLRADDIFGRYGGEEFVVFLPRTDFPTTLRVAERLKHNLANWSIPVEGQIILMTASFGVLSATPGPDTHVDKLLNTADQLLYRAKANGRNQIVWQ